MQTIVLVASYWKEPHRWMVCNLTLADLWQNLGYRVVVVCMHSKAGIIQQTDTLIVYGVKDLFIPDPFNFGIAPTYLFHVLRIIKQYKPTQIVSTSLLFWTSWTIIPLRLLGYKPVVITDALVGMTWWPRKWYMKIIMGIGGWTMGLLAMKLAHTLILFHPQPQRLLKAIGVAHKTHVIPSGIQAARYNYQIPDHTNNQPITISYVGRLESIKGVEDFLAAMSIILKKHTNVCVQVVGPHALDHPLYLQYKEQITFTGLRADIPAILQNTDIFVLPSYSEGLSNALMEAMSSGCACIATRVGGNAYLLEDFVSGFLYTPGDIESLVDRTEALLTDQKLRVAVARAARTRIEHVFDWPVVGQQFMNIFATL